jgi:nitrous oxidase accessory protein NosD
VRGGVTLGAAFFVLLASLYAPFASPSEPGEPPLPLQYPAHDPIRIGSDADFTTANGVVSGRGTSRDPYVIESWDIDATFGIGIHVSDTTDYFIIRNVNVANGQYGYDGILFENVRNAVIESVGLAQNYHGIQVIRSASVALNGVYATGSSQDGILVWQSSDVTVTDPFVLQAQLGIRVDESTSVVVLGGRALRNPSGGLAIGGGRDIRVASLNLSENGQGIAMFRTTNVTVENAELYANRGFSMWLNEISGVRFVGTRVVAAEGTGVYLYGSTDVEWTGGEIVRARFAAIEVWSSSDVRVSSTSLSAEEGPAVTVRNSDGLEVLDSNLSASLYGVEFSDVLNGTIRGNAFSRNGISLFGSLLEHHRHTIEANTVDGRPILAFRDCTGAVVDGVEPGAVFAVNCTGVRIANVAISRTETAVHLAWVDDAAIENVTVADPVRNGVFLIAVRTARLMRIHVDGAGLGPGPAWSGLAVVASSDVVLEDSTFTNLAGGTGVQLTGVSNARVSRISASGVAVGLTAIGGTGLELIQSTFLDHTTGLSVDGASGYRIEDNTISRASPAPGATGISLFYAGQGDFVANRIDRHGVGIDLFASNGVRIWGNRFVGNTLQAEDDSGPSNQWDGGYPTGGNFWSNHGGWDDCSGPAQDVCPDSDGWGDRPYPIDGDSMDRYPLIEVNPVNVPPIAWIESPPSVVTVGVLVPFDGSRSSDPDGSLSGFAWDFGDGGMGTGPIASHAFAAEGTYTVTLEVTDERRATDSVSVEVTVAAVAPPPEITLAVVEHPSGFRIPLPQGWTITRDETDGGSVTELQADGTYNGTPVNILVDVAVEPSVQETQAYMESLVDQFMDEIRRTIPDAVLLADPVFGTAADHAAVTLGIGYASVAVSQRATFVLSNPHDRIWFILTTMASWEYGNLRGMHDAIVAGLVITMTPAAPDTLAIAGILGGIGGAAAVAIVLLVVVLRHRRKPPPPVYYGGAAPVASPWQAPAPCPGCGIIVPAGAQLCPRCGTPLAPPPPGPPTK